MGTVRNPDILHYFEYSAEGIEVVEDGLKVIPFGEYLVERRALSRDQLFQALCEQDKYPEVPLGEIVAALGYMKYADVDRMLAEFNSLPCVEIC